MALDALEAIRNRRAVRAYTDRPVSDADLDRLLRLALLAPTGHGAQSWSLIVVREPERRAALAELVLSGAAEYFRVFRPRAEGASDEEHAASARGYAEQVLGSYRQVPVWICAVIVPRYHYPDDELMEHIERFSDVTSLAFALENLFVAARALGLGTTPTNFHFFHEPEYRELLGLTPELGVHYLTPLGYPPEFPVGLRPALAKARRPWRSLVHDEQWGRPRNDPRP
jgi:nitroreductase